MNPFDNVVFSLTRSHTTHPVYVKEQDFSTFMREYTFDKLSGLDLAQSFMKKFHVDDEVLSRQGLSDEFVQKYIQGTYVKTVPTHH
jgi:hypothetical protein